MFELVGLDSDADATYAVMLDGQPRTIDQLVGLTGLARTQLRGAVRSLEAHHLIQGRAGRLPAYAALDPAIALDLLLVQQEERIKRARAIALAFSEAFRFMRGTA